MSIGPAITVIMPVHNAEKYVAEAIESVLKQTYVDFEFLIFNDGSTDRSLEVIMSFEDSRISVISSKKNNGYVAHLNDGIRRTKGKYIARMDSDDISLPTRFEKQFAFLESNPDTIMCGTFYYNFGMVQGSASLPVWDHEIRAWLLFGNAFCHPSVMIKSSSLKDNDLNYDVELMPSEDYCLWTMLLEYGKCHNVDEFLIKYRTHQSNASKILRNDYQQQKRDQVHLDYIKRVLFIPEFEEMDYELLLNFFSKNLIPKRGTIEALSILLNKIRLNFSSKEIDKSYLMKQINWHFYSMCTNSTSQGLWLFNKYILSEFTIESWNLNLRMFIKCLLPSKWLRLKSV